MSGAAQLLAVVGCALVCLSGIGVVRFGDVLARLHALTKASALGMLVVLCGAALGAANADDATSLLLAALLQLMTLPIGANLIGRAAYRMARAGGDTDGYLVDELDDDEGEDQVDGTGRRQGVEPG